MNSWLLVWNELIRFWWRPWCGPSTTNCAVFMCWWENSPTGTQLAIVLMLLLENQTCDCFTKCVTCKLQFATWENFLSLVLSTVLATHEWAGERLGRLANVPVIWEQQSLVKCDQHVTDSSWGRWSVGPDWKIRQQLLDGLPWSLVHTFMSPTGGVVTALWSPWPFIHHHLVNTC